ncbi:hypothetical protein JCM17844_24050 [Iodidimonas gelatinilytica]|uniref:EamA domain-containing protein n=1 Tax=Iodidimonas gelatinilytica TaxID=1236966 RepID=A0A5A7N0S8_9PROT|nr:EamA family transporter [Iodidimonas gelatinilytica]GEQ98768.1 hypothetical protein JCM17844_24050 [Iodidimonas gelatinilytica]GER01305.1 hypothetical protein JCM17845_19280 [Iodidimonas gelatinilytica]
MALYAVLTGTPPALDLGVGYVVSFLYLTVFGTVAGFTIYLTLLKTWGLGRTAYVAIAIPLVALAVSTIFENYQWTPLAVAGVGLVLVGNLMLIRKKRPALMATDSLSNPEKPVV